IIINQKILSRKIFSKELWHPGIGGRLRKKKPGDDLEGGNPLHLLYNWKFFMKRYCYRRAQEDVADKNRIKENGKGQIQNGFCPVKMGADCLRCSNFL
ncbi:MAG: hypothetical protein NTV04_06295, partial [Deltaproteobacteria bacterium]|nr:hypothetical protein [Deltaproteobacteria bacterium]